MLRSFKLHSQAAKGFTYTLRRVERQRVGPFALYDHCYSTVVQKNEKDSSTCEKDHSYTNTGVVDKGVVIKNAEELSSFLIRDLGSIKSTINICKKAWRLFDQIHQLKC